MIVLCGSASGPAVEAKLSRPNFGIMLSPSSWRTPWKPYWAADNDAYANRNDPGWWDRKGESAWFRMLDKIGQAEHQPLFAVLPDVVADWPRTLERAHIYKPELDARGITPALALQDGCNGSEQYRQARLVDAPAVFVGGSTRWKWLNVEPLRREFWQEWFHCGRVNGPRQIRECLRIGVDSVDGTGWAKHSRKMVPLLLAALDGRYQAENGRLPL